MNIENQIPTKLQSVINRSSVKAFCLHVSRTKRAGKFTRVSEEFLTKIESEVEATIRQTARYVEGYSTLSPDNREFVTGEAMKKIREKLNERTRQIIESKVRSHPSIGQTLI